MSAQTFFKIGMDLQELQRSIDAVETLGQQEGWSPDLILRVNFVLEELGVNIINHGDTGDTEPHEIELIMTSDAECVTIEIIDDCRAFNPLTDAPVPDLDASLSDRPIGGLGIHLSRTLMDDMRYTREEGKNHVTLVARRSK